MTEGNIRFVTIATHSERYFPVLEQSAKRNGIELEVLGWGMRYSGHHMKDELMIEYLRTLSDNPVVVFVDGFDSIFIAGPDEFMTMFNSMFVESSNQNKILVSRDFDPCWFSKPLTSYYYSRVFTRCADLYINSGMFMGRSNELLEFMEKAKAWRNPKINSNQICWSRFWNDFRNPRPFTIDDNAKIFFNYGVQNNEEQLNFRVYPHSKRIFLEKTQTHPLVISGPGSTCLDQVVKDLGYELMNPMSSSLQWKSRLDKLPYYIRTFYPEILLLSLGGIVLLSYKFKFAFPI